MKPFQLPIRTQIFYIEIYSYLKQCFLLAGVGSAWLLDEVIVEIPSKGEKYRFCAKKWLDGSKGVTEISLAPVEAEKVDAG